MSEAHPRAASDAGEAMTTTGDENPIQLVRVTCPVCRTVNEYETVRPGAYMEVGTDTDFRPLSRRWTHPGYQAVHPLLYFTATCSTCFFTREMTRAFRDGETTQGCKPEVWREVRRRHLEELANPNSVIRRLSASLWPQSYPYRTAISKLLLAVHCEHLLPTPSHSDLARWYLRIAWLFCDLSPRPGIDWTSPLAQSRRDWARALEEMTADLERLRARATGMTRFLQSHPEAVQRNPDDDLRASQCRQHLHQLDEQLQTLGQTIAALNAGGEAEAGFVGATDGALVNEPFGDYPSYTDFLRALKMDSPLVAIHEDDARLRALHHYKLAFDAHGGIAAGNGAMMTAYLIGELARRLAYFDEAERHFALAREAAAAAIADSGADRSRSALARHIADLAERQASRLYDVAAGIE